MIHSLSRKKSSLPFLPLLSSFLLGMLFTFSLHSKSYLDHTSTWNERETSSLGITEETPTRNNTIRLSEDRIINNMLLADVCLEAASIPEGSFDLSAYPEGTFFYEDQGVKIGLAKWRQDPNGPGNNNGGLASIKLDPPFSYHILYSTGANGLFDFSEIDGNVDGVTFDIEGYYGRMNVSVNGSTWFVGELDDLPTDLGGGITVVKNYQPNEPGTISFYGPDIQRIVLGNDQGFSILGLCFTAQPENNDISECINFVPFPGGSYGASTGETPGFVVPTLTNSEAIVSIEEYGEGTSNAIFGILEFPSSAQNPNTLINTDLLINFANVPGTVTEVSLDIYSGVVVEFGINGEPMTVVNFSTDSIPPTLPGGATVVTEIRPGNMTFDTLTVTISANQLNTFRFGDVDMLFNNICYKFTPANEVDNCFAFTDFPDGTRYGTPDQSPGFIMSTSDSNIVISLEEYLDFNNNTNFGSIEKEVGTDFSFLFDMNLKADFTNVPGTVTSLSFEFQVGVYFNFSVNGEALTLLNELPVGSTTLPSGAEITRESVPGTNRSRCTISHPDLQSVIFGATDFWLYKDICYTFTPDNNCSITNFVATKYCNDRFLEVNFDYQNPGNDFFELYLDGALYETYAFADLPLGIQFPPGVVLPNTAKVCVNDFPDCCSDLIDINPIDCEPCDLNDITIFYEIQDCNPDGFFEVLVSPDVTNNSDSFVVIGNGQIYGTFSYFDIANVGPFFGDGTSIYELGVYDQANPDCTEWVEFGPVTCQLAPCAIVELQVIQFCSNNVLEVDMIVDNPGNDLFDLYLDGNLYGTYPLSDLPLSIQLPAGTDTYTTAKICINDNPNCCNTVDVIPEGCNEPCDISDLIVEVWDCDDDGNFLVDINFNYTGVSDSFYVKGNGNNYGLFAYTDLWLTLGSFPGDGTTEYEFVIIDQNNPNCTASVDIGTVECDVACNIYNLVAEVSDCDANNSYTVEIDFDIQNPGANGFMVIGDGIFYGVFDYAALPITLGPFLGNPNQGMQFNIFDAQDPSCIGLVETEAVDCNANCELSNLSLFREGCINGLNYYLIDFDYNNTISDEFTVSVLGNNLGTYNYADLPVLVQIPPTIVGLTNFIICDVDAGSSNCCIDGSTFIEDCGFTCPILSVETEAIECQNGEFYIAVAVEAIDNPGSNGYTLFANTGGGFSFGPFNYPPTLQVIGPFSTSTPGPIEIQALDITNNCEATTLQEVPVCNDPCSITELEVIALECTSDTTLAVKVNFDYANPGNDYFEVTASNSETFGPFLLSDLPITITNFPTTDLFWNYLSVCINDQPNCCQALDFQGLDCEGYYDCPIISVETEAIECDNGEFYIAVSVEAIDNPASNGYTLFANTGGGFSYGPFNYPPTLQIIGPFSTSTPGPIEIQAIDISNDCEVITYQEVPLCGDPCSITELEVISLECTSDTTLAVKINFDYANPGNDYFEVTAWNSETFGPFLLSDLPVTITNFPTTDQVWNYLSVCINDQPNCCQALDFQDLDCTDECEIRDLQANWEGCNPDGTGSIYVNFIYENPGNDFFDVYFQGEFLGYYELNDLPLIINNVPNVGHNQGIDQLKVCINDTPDCCAVVDFDVMNCPSDYTCIDFESFDIGLIYLGDEIVPGELVGEVGGVPIRFGDCYEVTDFSIFEIRSEFNTGNNCGGLSNSGQTLFLQGAGIELDFSGHSPLPSVVSFDFCNEGYLSITGETDSIFFDGTAQDITLASGLQISIMPYGANSPLAGSVTITGTIEDLSICGAESSIDNICFNSSPPSPNNDCVQFEELEDGFSYDPNNHDPLLLESNGVAVTMLPNTVYVQATSTPQWTMFNAASGLHLFIGGDLEFDFTGVGDPLQFVSFDFSGGIDNKLTVNGGNVFEFDFNTPDTVLNIAPGVTMHFNRDATNTVEGSISLFGDVEEMVVSGVELAIDNVCYYTDIQEAQVWPGDTNEDNIANHCDLLNLGIAYGEQGPARNDQSTDWGALDAADWMDFYADGETNFKHSDCNGDGIVDEKDLDVIEINYDLTHGPVEPVITPPATPDDPPFFVDLESLGTLSPGQIITAPIVLGSLDIPVEEIYGIAFTIEFDPQLIQLGTVDVQVKESWLGTPEVDILSIDRSAIGEGRIEVAISRINQTNADGFGAIADFIGVIDDIVAKQVSTVVSIKHIKAINFAEETVLLHTPVSPGVISTDISDKKDPNGLLIYPIPTSNLLHIENYNREEMRLITVYNALGQRLLEQRYPKQQTTIDVSSWPSGIYFVEIKLPDLVLSRKFKVTQL